MMMVEMATEQRYLHHDDNSGFRMPPLTPVMHNSRSIKIVEEAYCPGGIIDAGAYSHGTN